MTLNSYYRLAAVAAARRDTAVKRSAAIFNAYDRWAKLYGPLAYERFRGAMRRRSQLAIERTYEARVARNEAQMRMTFDREAMAQAQREAAARRREMS